MGYNLDIVGFGSILPKLMVLQKARDWSFHATQYSEKTIMSLVKMQKILFVFLVLFFTGEVNSAGGKLVRHANIGVTFEIDGMGRLQSLATHGESNRILLPMLQEKFGAYQFKPRMHEGVPVSASLQAIVRMLASEAKDGQLNVVFKDPQFQAVRTGGESLNYLALIDIVSKRSASFEVTIKVRPDGSVADSDVKAKGLRVPTEATALIEKTVATWTFAVDKEAGIPLAMVTEVNFQVGSRGNINMPSIGQPMRNPSVGSSAPIKR